MFMKRNQHLTSPQSTKEKLQIAHKVIAPDLTRFPSTNLGLFCDPSHLFKWLDRVQRASSGDPYWQRVFVRYDRLIEFKHEKTRMQQIIREAFVRFFLLSLSHVLISILSPHYYRLSNKSLPIVRSLLVP